ncbi:hypothetical protein K1T71_009543 [Dendrolimus kikuchii]|uniref:Uncharacterized protein n=1 Tax=Dendrolimus kikuchii TaxID=765133 RepID=A0ACC1CS49_9NEOP|nr:hypothetical protein K1T71_009543 [Dendrolimus kikuchii]
MKRYKEQGYYVRSKRNRSQVSESVPQSSKRVDKLIKRKVDEAIQRIQLLAHYNDLYKKTVTVNGVYMKAYLDTGSELNVISKAAVDAIKLKVTPVEIVLKGFNNSLVRAVGQVEFELLVDKVEIKTTAVATDVDLGDVVLIIGYWSHM